MKNKYSKGFTLIELLVVMVIIGILAALIVPNVAGAFASAKKSKTMTFFKGLEGAFEQYYTEYKTLPSGGTLWGTAGSARQVNSDTGLFIETLTGRPRSGTTYNAGDYNPKRIPFFSFDSSMVLDSNGEPDYAGSQSNIVDAFGNVDIRMVMASNPANPNIPRNALGTVAASSVPGGPADGGSLSTTGSGTPVPANIYKRVVFYSAGRGSGVSDIVGSW